MPGEKLQPAGALSITADSDDLARVFPQPGKLFF
jgi:hypothetical protein